jgi:RNA polymerase sigma-B factor
MTVRRTIQRGPSSSTVDRHEVLSEPLAVPRAVSEIEGTAPRNTMEVRDLEAENASYQPLERLLAAYAATPTDDRQGSALRHRLIIGYLPVAKHIAQRYAQRGEPLEDLVQVATMGLINAIDRYQPERAHHFLGYAIPTITGEVRRHFRDKAWSMRVPRRLKELHLSVNKVAGQLHHELGRAPKPSEIAARLDVSVDEVLQGLEASEAYRADSLDQMRVDTDDGPTLGDKLGVSDAHYEQFVDSYALAPYLAALPARERNILIMRFFHEMTQSQIAEKLGISQMHVSRLLAKTLAGLRNAVNGDHPCPRRNDTNTGTDTDTAQVAAR